MWYFFTSGIMSCLRKTWARSTLGENGKSPGVRSTMKHGSFHSGTVNVIRKSWQRGQSFIKPAPEFLKLKLSSLFLEYASFSLLCGNHLNVF